MIRYYTLIFSLSSLFLYANNDTWYSTLVQKPHKANSALNQIYAKQYGKSDSNNYAAGFKQNEIVSWEASYSDFGTSEKKSASSYAVNGKFSLNNGEGVNTSLKVGIHKWEQDFEKYNDKGTDLFYGLEIDIPISDQVSANMNYDTFQVDGSDLNKISIEMVYKF